MPTKKEDPPRTLKRSPKKGQRDYQKALDSAHETYDDEERARRTAWASVKHVAEKQGDHWELKDEPGPSDAQAAQGGREARENPKPTHGGVDVRGNSKQELYERAKELDVSGRSKMKKKELVEAIQKENDRKTAKTRS